MLIARGSPLRQAAPDVLALVATTPDKKKQFVFDADRSTRTCSVYDTNEQVDMTIDARGFLRRTRSKKFTFSPQVMDGVPDMKPSRSSRSAASSRRSAKKSHYLDGTASSLRKLAQFTEQELHDCWETHAKIKGDGARKVARRLLEIGSRNASRSKPWADPNWWKAFVVTDNMMQDTVWGNGAVPGFSVLGAGGGDQKFTRSVGKRKPGLDTSGGEIRRSSSKGASSSSVALAGKGLVSKLQFARALKSLLGSGASKDADDLYDQLDEGGVGGVGFDKLGAALKQLMEDARLAIPDNPDLDGREVSREEEAARLMEEERLRALAEAAEHEKKINEEAKAKAAARKERQEAKAAAAAARRQREEAEAAAEGGGGGGKSRDLGLGGKRGVGFAVKPPFQDEMSAINWFKSPSLFSVTSGGPASRSTSKGAGVRSVGQKSWAAQWQAAATQALDASRQGVAAFVPIPNMQQAASRGGSSAGSGASTPISSARTPPSSRPSSPFLMA